MPSMPACSVAGSSATPATKVESGDTVLVLGATGGLGLLWVQLGRARAKRVVALARGAKTQRVRTLGPDATIDPGRADWLDQARAELPEAGADVVLDNIGGDLGEASFSLVAPGGRFSGHGTPSGRFAQVDRQIADRLGIAVSSIETVQLSGSAMKHYTDRALREAADGNITPLIGQIFSLEQAGSAHAAIQNREVFGKTLLTSREC